MEAIQSRSQVAAARTAERMPTSDSLATDVDATVAPMAYAAMFSAVPILLMPFLFIFPLTFGFLALRDIKRNPRYAGRGRAIFGICWGIIGLFFTAIIVFILMANAGRR